MIGRIFILIVFICLEIMSFGQESDYVYWSVDRLLKWNDFQGSPIDTAKVYDGFNVDAMAFIEYHPEFGYNKDSSAMYAVFFVKFDKKHSFVNKKSGVILEHEQGHFNLAEVHARMIRRDWQYLDVWDKNFSLKTDSIQNLYLDKLKGRHRKYDDETFYGTFEDAQDSLLIEISNELESLEEYTDTIFFYFRKPEPIKCQRKCCKK